MPVMPLTKAWEPMRANWTTAEPPPQMTKSPMVTWPAIMALLEKMQSLPTLQSWPMCELARKAQRSPIDRLHAPAGGAGVHGHPLADQAVGADRERRLLAAIFQILRLVADGGEGKNAGARADPGASRQHDMRFQLRAVAEFDMRADVAERADLDVGAELRPVLDDGGRMNGHVTPWRVR